ncbi:MAG: DnaJ domain-containing protein [Armatimonadota bacterium]|nr:DnaJ domain-containing protein [Armatimonadota bacterium]
MRCEKDYYAVLGVSATATPEEIREAYLARVRLLHPDRFDEEKQPAEWRLANAMMADLNEAFEVLGDAEARAKYDAQRAAGAGSPQQEASSRTQAEADQSSPLDTGELTAGCVAFSRLPLRVQRRLLERQRNKGEAQVQIPLRSYGWQVVGILLLVGWCAYVWNSSAQGARWEGTARWWWGGSGVVLAMWGAHALVFLARWRRSALKPFFYVTPLYFIKTEFDVVSFWPIWALTDFKATHHYTNGVYQHCSVVLTFGEEKQELTISSRQVAEMFLVSLRLFQAGARVAAQEGHVAYFHNFDDFQGVDRLTPPADDLLSRPYRLSLSLAPYAMVAVCLLAGFGAEPGTHSPQASVPEEVEPGYVPVTPPAMVPVDNTDVSLAPNDAPPSAPPMRKLTPPKRTTPKPKPTLVKRPLPPNGVMQHLRKKRQRIAPFEVHAAADKHFYLKLVDEETAATVMTLFVRAGCTVETEVPLGRFELRYACGKDWYGTQKLFGPDTSCSKADTILEFSQFGNQVTGHSVTLYPVLHGNLSTTPIPVEAF